MCSSRFRRRKRSWRTSLPSAFESEVGPIRPHFGVLIGEAAQMGATKVVCVCALGISMPWAFEFEVGPIRPHFGVLTGEVTQIGAAKVVFVCALGISLPSAFEFEVESIRPHFGVLISVSRCSRPLNLRWDQFGPTSGVLIGEAAQMGAAKVVCVCTLGISLPWAFEFEVGPIRPHFGVLIGEVARM